MIRVTTQFTFLGSYGIDEDNGEFERCLGAIFKVEESRNLGSLF